MYQEGGKILTKIKTSQKSISRLFIWEYQKMAQAKNFSQFLIEGQTKPLAQALVQRVYFYLEKNKTLFQMTTDDLKNISNILDLFSLIVSLGRNSNNDIA